MPRPVKASAPALLPEINLDYIVDAVPLVLKLGKVEKLEVRFGHASRREQV